MLAAVFMSWVVRGSPLKSGCYWGHNWGHLNFDWKCAPKWSSTPDRSRPQSQKTKPTKWPMAAVCISRFRPRVLNTGAWSTDAPLTKKRIASLTFVRSSELRFARWDEFDFDKSLWRVPAKREEIKGARYSYRGWRWKRSISLPSVGRLWFVRSVKAD